MIQTELKQLIGSMNGDDPNEVIPSSCHKDALNVIFRGHGNNLSIENIVGNRRINFSLPTGINVNIGAYYDAVNNRIFYFNCNSNGLHGIYIIDAVTKSVTTLLKTSTSPDPLGFDANYPITSINIIRNDAVDGDILDFIDSLGRPTQINIPRYLAQKYPIVKRSFIDVAKAPPLMPIKCSYENDFNITANNLKGVFQFTYRYVYDNFEKSVWSTGSKVPLPFEPFDDNIANNRFYNARIALYMATGDKDVIKIEVAFRQSFDNTTSDYYLIDTIVKANLSIPDNDIFRFVFYNDGQYGEIDKKEQILLFDNVPLKAGAGILLNGNVRSYADITEGYNSVTSDIKVQSTATNILYDPNGVLFFAAQGGDDALGQGDNITLYLTGVGSNTSDGVVNTLDNCYFTINVKAVDANGGNMEFYFASTATTSVPIGNILTALSLNAQQVGYTFVSQTANSLTLSFAGIKLLTSTITTDKNANSFNKSKSVVSSFGVSSSYALGIYYRDEKGRGYTVTNNAGMELTTVDANSNLELVHPIVIANIKHRPPVWAVDYNFVLSLNKTYDKQLNWVSKQTVADALSVNNKRYAFIDISNISAFNEDLSTSASKPVDNTIAYDFAPGDRIKFIARFPINSTKVPLTAKQYDYEILGVVFSKIIAGNIRTGVFLKIKYPTADISGDFDFTGVDFQNYQIFVYSYSKHTSENTTTYFEIGHRYKIGNAGTANAYHIANNQIQSADLSSIAQEYISAADMSLRYRTVPSGITYQINYGGGNAFTYNLSTFLTTPNPIIDLSGNYNIHAQQSNLNSGLGLSEYPTITDNNYFFYNASSVANKTIRIRTTISMTSSDSTYFQLYAKLSYTGQTVANNILIVDDQSINATGTPKLYPVDITIVVPPLNAVFLLAAGSLGRNKTVVTSSLRLDISRDVTIPIIEKSTSDLSGTLLTSYSRPLLVNADAKQERKKTLFRFSQPRQQGTNINLTNRFYDNNTDEFDRQYGEVVRMVLYQQYLYIMQKRKNGTVGVYARFIKDKSGLANLITTDDIITPNNIQYDASDYGLSNQPMAVCSNGGVKYFADVVKGIIARRSQDGSQPLTELYGMQKWAGTNLSNYLTDTPYPFGGNAKVIACYNQMNDKHGEALFVLQNGTGRMGYTIAFDETRNAFTSFYSFVPDNLLCAGNVLVSWFNGDVYFHDNINAYNNFYGVQYGSLIKIVFNQYALLKRTFNTLSYQGSEKWIADTIGDINTQAINSQTGLRQQSQLIADDIELNENRYDAAFMGDANSRATVSEGINDGDYLEGTWLEIILRSTVAGTKKYLYGIYANFTKSNR